MKTIKIPLSIRLIYWFTNITLGLLSLVFIVAIVFNVLLYTDFFGNDVQLHTQLPVKVDFLEIGNLHLNDKDIKVELVEATTKIHFFNTPTFIAKKIGIILLIVVLVIGYITWIFKRFIVNVKNGIIFTIDNIKLLKKLAYGIIGFWIFTLVYSQLFYYYIAKNLEFKNVRIASNDVSVDSDMLFVALIIWVLAHIFIKGVQLQQEKDLTI
jgi:hypothetical protein